MKIGAVTLALNDESTLAGTINCLKNHVDYHIVLISEKSYFGDVYDNGECEKICDKLGVDYIKGNWPLDHHQRTLGNKICKKQGCDWVITFDSDELMDDYNLGILKTDMFMTSKGSLVCRPECYWHTTDFVLRPMPSYTPVIATRSDVEFPYIRNVNTDFELTRALMHHVSWASPKDVYKKVTCYAHATDFNGKQWYEDNYRNWDETKSVILPDGKYGVKFQPLPKDLLSCYQI